MGLTFHATDSIQLEDGVYPANLLGIDEAQTDGDEIKHYARWQFEVFSDLYPDGARLSANSSLAFGPKSKARKWFSAALGRAIEAGECITPDALLPLACRVLVKTDEATGFVRVEDVLKAASGQAKPVADDDDIAL